MPSFRDVEKCGRVVPFFYRRTGDKLDYTETLELRCFIEGSEGSYGYKQFWSQVQNFDECKKRKVPTSPLSGGRRREWYSVTVRQTRILIIRTFIMILTGKNNCGRYNNFKIHTSLKPQSNFLVKRSREVGNSTKGILPRGQPGGYEGESELCRRTRA